MTFCPILPKLKEGELNRTENFNKAGDWASRQPVELERISRSLKTEQLEFEINSIPDMWARPILFEMALLDPTHSLHHRILGEWRGLMALIALKELRKLKLSALPLRFNNGNPGNEGSDFLQTLAKLIPNKTIARDTTWENLYIFLYRGRAVGITSPVTLVCTSTYYYNYIHGVPWFDGRFLNDPIPFLNINERKALCLWLEKLREAMPVHEGIDVKMDEFNKIMKAINQFTMDLGETPSNQYELSKRGLGMERGIFRLLDKPIRTSPEYTEVSYVSLKPSVAEKVSPTLLVVDRAIAQQWDMHERDIIVYESIPMGGIPFSGLTGNRNIILGTHLEDSEWCNVEDFFTEKLFVIEGKNAFPGTMDSDGCDELTFQDSPVTPIVPLSDILLKYLKTDDIARRVRFEQLKDKIKVFLYLPLTGPDGNGKDFIICKEFGTKGNDIVVLRDVPDLEVWPNFIIPDWNIYYSYFSATGERGIYAEPYPPNIITDSREFRNKRDVVERKFHQMNHFPEAFMCKCRLSDSRNRQFLQHDAGVLLLNKPMSKHKQSTSFKLGVDFGTSGTNAYYQHGTNQPDRIQFQDRFLQVTTASVSKRTELYDHFLPGKTETTPFLSVFHDFRITNHAISPLLDGHIYFLQDPKYFNACGDGMMTDLKWGDNEERKRSRAFLKQLSLQCVAEIINKGAGAVNWNFSYPSAFSRKDTEAFTVIWEQIAKEISQSTGLSLTESKPVSRSESIASAAYFACEEDLKATLTRGALFIDIGGGTSDISIWQGKKMLFQTSLRFAGRDMFSSLLWKKPDFLNLFDKPENVANLTNDVIRRNEVAFHAQADALVSKGGDNFLKKLPELGSEECVVEFVQLIALGITGIFYYMGMVLKSLKGREIYKDPIPNVYIGGNGSRLLHWLASGSFKTSSPINHMLRGILLNVSELASKKDFGIHISPAPKSEVACGLVNRDIYIDINEAAVIEEYIAGESFLLPDKRDGHWAQTLSTNLLKSGLRTPGQLVFLEEFIKQFNSLAEEAGLPSLQVDSTMLGHIKDRVDDELGDYQNVDESEIRIQSIFIIALKNLMERKSNDWKQKHSG